MFKADAILGRPLLVRRTVNARRQEDPRGIGREVLSHQMFSKGRVVRGLLFKELFQIGRQRPVGLVKLPEDLSLFCTFVGRHTKA